MNDRKFARYVLAVGLIFCLMGGVQVLLDIDYKDGLPLMLLAGLVLTFAGLVSVFLNRGSNTTDDRNGPALAATDRGHLTL